MKESRSVAVWKWIDRSFSSILPIARYFPTKKAMVDYWELHKVDVRERIGEQLIVYLTRAGIARALNMETH